MLTRDASYTPTEFTGVENLLKLRDTRTVSAG